LGQVAQGESRGRPAVFLDRDGVLVKVQASGETLNPSLRPSDVELLPGVTESVQRLREAGFTMIVVTNQPDVARGLLDMVTLHRIHDRLIETLAVDAIYYCPHDNDAQCRCRKPKPGLILRAAEEWHIDLGASFLIGDRWVDLAAAEAAGVVPVLLETPYTWDPTSAGAPQGVATPRFSSQSLKDCTDFILASSQE
jgi:D-glycero-D-manno-heptose 1,7-bisphosphate phosphatase